MVKQSNEMSITGGSLSIFIYSNLQTYSHVTLYARVLRPVLCIYFFTAPSCSLVLPRSSLTAPHCSFMLPRYSPCASVAVALNFKPWRCNI